MFLFFVVLLLVILDESWLVSFNKRWRRLYEREPMLVAIEHRSVVDLTRHELKEGLLCVTLDTFLFHAMVGVESAKGGKNQRNEEEDYLEGNFALLFNRKYRPFNYITNVILRFLLLYVQVCRRDNTQLVNRSTINRAHLPDDIIRPVYVLIEGLAMDVLGCSLRSDLTAAQVELEVQVGKHLCVFQWSFGPQVGGIALKAVRKLSEQLLDGKWGRRLGFNNDSLCYLIVDHSLEIVVVDHSCEVIKHLGLNSSDRIVDEKLLLSQHIGRECCHSSCNA